LLLTAVPSFDLRRIAHTLPSGADGLEGPPTTKFYELRDNLPPSGEVVEGLVAGGRKVQVLTLQDT
jgi:hypothetical protein